LIRAGAPNLGAEMVDRNAGEIATLEPEARLYVAVLMSRIGYSLPAFKVLTALFQDVPRMISQSTMRVFFPLAYYEIVKAKQAQVDPLLLLSLIRQESAFNKEAHSSAGARGLMQVMPATARSVASMRAKTLFDPFTNVKIGTKFFMKRLGDFDGDVELTLAAYNAGANRVEQWRKRYPTTNKMLFLDFIPFRETREYVSSILRNYYWYVKLYSPSVIGGVPEGSKISVVDTKVLAIMNANAGAAAMLTNASGRK
jgi:soluble lytic murein transglycosylase